MKTRLRVPSYCLKLIHFNDVVNCLTTLGGVVDRGLLALFVYVTLSVPFIAFSDIGAEWNPTGNPIGGGPGYSDSLRHQDADFYVVDKIGLLSALSNAGPGSIIYVADWAEIDMTGEITQNISERVTLASGRGRIIGDTTSWGGLIYLNDTDGRGDYPVFQFVGRRGRITGLRLRGSYSEMEGGRPGTDTFPNNYIKEECIRIASADADSCEVDNCEIWGFTVALNARAGEDGYFHHNYIHNNNHGNGGGYGTNDGGSGEIIVEANLVDWHSGPIVGAGTNSDSLSYYEARWNYILGHGYHCSFERHASGSGGTGGYAPPIYVHHNTTQARYFLPGNVTGIWFRGVLRPNSYQDSVHIHHNWFWDQDSASSINVYSDYRVRVWENHFTTTPPAGVTGRIPAANIVASVDSGTVPLVVSFKATGSSDPDGDICAYYWKFGEDVYARYTDITDSVQHTFLSIGNYRVELMVTDDHGIPSTTYKDIKVVPADDSSWLSVWVKDRWHGDEVGYYTKQILLDGEVVWTDDIAGDEGWQHVITNVTDMIGGKDSVTIALRLYCEQDNGDGLFRNLWVYWDDVVLYGADVNNGNFEADENWVYSCGTMSGDNWNCCKDGTWLSGYIVSRDVRSGMTSFFLGNQYGYDTYQGEWVQVEQKVAVTASGITPSYSDAMVCSLYFPYPNPARIQTQFGYTLDIMSKVSFNIYDVSGRFVRNIIEGTQMPGEYDMMWDGRDYAGKSVANGVYFLRFSAGDYEETKQIVWLR